MQVPPPQRENPTPGGLGTGTADSLSSEFQALRASITAKLRNATTEGIGATASKATIHALGDDDDYDDDGGGDDYVRELYFREILKFDRNNYEYFDFDRFMEMTNV